MLFRSYGQPFSPKDAADYINRVRKSCNCSVANVSAPPHKGGISSFTISNQVRLPEAPAKLDMSLEDALKYTFSSGRIKGLTGEQVMADKSLKAHVKATMRVHTGAEQEAAKAIANTMT